MEKVHRTIYCRQRTLSSLAIRVFDGFRQWSHAAGILDGGEHVIEARAWTGVVITPLADVISRSSEFKIVERPAPMKGVGDAWALRSVGCPYDWLGALGVKWNRNWEDDWAWFCSEHDAMWQLKNGHPLVRKGTRGVSPNDSYMIRY